MAFTKKLNAEERRGLAEQLTEEALVVFDLLTKPNITLTQQEGAEVKASFRQGRSSLAFLQRMCRILCG
jgi:type I restriction enzyme R subunit